MTQQKTYGSELRRIRKETGVTMAHVAQKVGCSTQHIHHLETDFHAPPLCPFKTLSILQAIRRPDKWLHLIRLEALQRMSVTLDLNGLPEWVAETLIELRAAQCEDRLTFKQWEQIRSIIVRPADDELKDVSYTGSSHDNGDRVTWMD